MNKTLMFLLIFFLLSSFTLAKPVVISTNLDVNSLFLTPNRVDFVSLDGYHEFFLHVYNSTGFIIYTNTSCNLHLYDVNGADLLETPLTLVGLDFFYNISASYFDVVGVYPYLVYCNNSQAGFYSSAFEVTSTGLANNKSGTGLLSIVILIPLFFALFMLIGAASLGEDHSVLRLFLFLLSVPMVWVSLNWGVIGVVNYYGLLGLQDNIGSFTYWTSWLFFVLISYVIIYSLWKLFDYLKGEREEKLLY